MEPAYINIWAILAAAAASVLLGFMWYSNYFLGKPWIKAAKIPMEYTGNMGITYLVTYISAYITAYVLAVLVYYTNARDFSDAIKLGFWVWLGFIAATTISSVLFERRSKVVYLINTGYYLVSIMLMTIILTYWR